MDRGHCCQGIVERALRGAKTQSWGLKRPPAGRGCRPKGLTHFPWDDPAVACATNEIVTVQCQRVAHASTCAHNFLVEMTRRVKARKLISEHCANEQLRQRARTVLTAFAARRRRRHYSTWSTSKKRGWDRTPLIQVVMRTSSSGSQTTDRGLTAFAARRRRLSP